MDDPDLRTVDEVDTDEVPTSRAYFHLACKSYTTVTGSDFYDLSNPFVPSSSTYCVECEDFAGLNQVYWAETEESIAKYRQRLLKEIPLGRRILYWVATPVLGALLAFVAGAIFLDWVFALIFLAPFSALFSHLGGRKYVLRWLCRLEFRDCP